MQANKVKVNSRWKRIYEAGNVNCQPHVWWFLYGLSDAVWPYGSSVKGASSTWLWAGKIFLKSRDIVGIFEEWLINDITLPQEQVAPMLHKMLAYSIHSKPNYKRFAKKLRYYKDCLCWKSERGSWYPMDRMAESTLARIKTKVIIGNKTLRA